MVMMVLVGIVDQGFYRACDRCFPRRVHQFVEIRPCITLEKIVVFLNKEETKTLGEKKKKKKLAPRLYSRVLKCFRLTARNP